MKIARLYLEDDDPMLAESYINRASLLQVNLITKLHCYEQIKIVILFCQFRLNPKMKSYKFVIKYAMPEFWITVVNLLRLHKGTMNYHIDQL